MIRGSALKAGYGYGVLCTYGVKQEEVASPS